MDHPPPSNLLSENLLKRKPPDSNKQPKISPEVEKLLVTENEPKPGSSGSSRLNYDTTPKASKVTTTKQIPIKLYNKSLPVDKHFSQSVVLSCDLEFCPEEEEYEEESEDEHEKDYDFEVEEGDTPEKGQQVALKRSEEQSTFKYNDEIHNKYNISKEFNFKFDTNRHQFNKLFYHSVFICHQDAKFNKLSKQEKLERIQAELKTNWKSANTRVGEIAATTVGKGARKRISVDARMGIGFQKTLLKGSHAYNQYNFDKFIHSDKYSDSSTSAQNLGYAAEVKFVDYMIQKYGSSVKGYEFKSLKGKTFSRGMFCCSPDFILFLVDGSFIVFEFKCLKYYKQSLTLEEAIKLAKLSKEKEIPCIMGTDKKPSLLKYSRIWYQVVVSMYVMNLEEMTLMFANSKLLQTSDADESCFYQINFKMTKNEINSTIKDLERYYHHHFLYTITSNYLNNVYTSDGKVNTSSKKSKCIICDDHFNVLEMKLHIRSHFQCDFIDPESQDRCNFVSSVYNDKYDDLLKHKQMEHGILPVPQYPCKEKGCNYLATSPRTLYLHARSHNKQVCEICKSLFNSKTIYQHYAFHIATWSKCGQLEIFPCLRCEETFRYPDFQQHLNENDECLDHFDNLTEKEKLFHVNRISRRIIYQCNSCSHDQYMDKKDYRRHCTKSPNCRAEFNKEFPNEQISLENPMIEVFLCPNSSCSLSHEIVDPSKIRRKIDSRAEGQFVLLENKKTHTDQKYRPRCHAAWSAVPGKTLALKMLSKKMSYSVPATWYHLSLMAQKFDNLPLAARRAVWKLESELREKAKQNKSKKN